MSPTKNEIRQMLLTKRKALSRSEVKKRGGYVCEQLLGLIPENALIVALYVPIQREVDVFPLVSKLIGLGKRVCLPVVSDADSNMVFQEFTAESTLGKGAFDVRIPVGGEVLVPEVVIVPLVGFDRRGHRIGYGKGYYDRALAGNAGVLAIGVAYDFQEVDVVPESEYDVKLDKIVTDKEVIECH